MNDLPPEWGADQIRAAIERYNGSPLTAFSSSGYEVDGLTRFKLKRIVRLDSRVLAIGELQRNGNGRPAGPAQETPLVLAWRSGPGGALADIETFRSESEAIDALAANSYL